MEPPAAGKPPPILRPWHLGLAVAVLVAGTAALVSHPEGADPTQDPVAMGLSLLLLVGWAAAAWRVFAARRGWERRAWRWFAAAGLLVPLGVAAYLASALAGAPLPIAWLSMAFLGIYALMLGGLLPIAQRQAGPRQTARLLLDAAIMAGAFFFVLWSAVYRDIPSPPGALGDRALLMAYPTLDAALATVALLSLATPAAGRPPGYTLFLTGIAMAPLGDAVGAYAGLTGSHTAAEVGAIGRLGSSLLLLLGTIVIRRGPAWPEKAAAPQPLWVELLPIAPMALALGTAVQAQREHGALAPLQFWIAVVVIALFIARLALTLVQNHRLRAALEQTAAAKTQLLRFVSHEMANPLSPLGIQVRIVRDGDPGKHANAWQIIDRSLARLNTLSGDVRDMALAETGRIVQATQETALAAEVAAACQSAEAVAAARGIRLACDPGPDGLRVRIDRQRFGQALDNLLSNAVKFTPAGGAVTVTARPAGHFAEVVVRDSGVGLTKEQLGSLFAPFSRPHGEAPGLGLGLYLSRSIVEAMGGTLTAASDGPGAGSAFAIAIPAATEAPATPGVARKPTA